MEPVFSVFQMVASHPSPPSPLPLPPPLLPLFTETAEPTREKWEDRVATRLSETAVARQVQKFLSSFEAIGNFS